PNTVTVRRRTHDPIPRSSARLPVRLALRPAYVDIEGEPARFPRYGIHGRSDPRAVVWPIEPVSDPHRKPCSVAHHPAPHNGIARAWFEQREERRSGGIHENARQDD